VAFVKTIIKGRIFNKIGQFSSYIIKPKAAKIERLKSNRILAQAVWQDQAGFSTIPLAARYRKGSWVAGLGE
jgi:hypothetical protein